MCRLMNTSSYICLLCFVLSVCLSVCVCVEGELKRVDRSNREQADRIAALEASTAALQAEKVFIVIDLVFCFVVGVCVWILPT